MVFEIIKQIGQNDLIDVSAEVSDLGGKKMQVVFQESLLGNIIGSDENSVKLLKEIADMVNVYPIMGVNEYAAYNALKSLNKDLSDGKDYTSLSQETLDAMAKLNELGCRKLAEDFLKLSDDERNDFIDVLGDMKPYDTVEVNKKIFILVGHALSMKIYYWNIHPFLKVMDNLVQEKYLVSL